MGFTCKCHLTILLTICLILSSCVDQQTRERDVVVKNMSNCEKVQGLIKAHEGGFVNIRERKTVTNKMDIYSARYQLVGDRCQVWHWGAGDIDYVCSVISPSNEIANEYYIKAKNFTQECLGEEWILTESPRQVGNGTKAIFKKSGENTIVATHIVQTQGLYKTEWGTYYFVGDAAGNF